MKMLNVHIDILNFSECVKIMNLIFHIKSGAIAAAASC